MITLKTYNNQSINPSDDAILYDSIVGKSGIISGCELTHLGANQIRIGTGRMMIKGRIVTVTEETIYVTLSTSGTVNGRLLIHMDLSDTEEPIRFISQAAATLPDLVQNEYCNTENGIYEIELATYTVSGIAISSLVINRPLFPESMKKLIDKIDTLNTNFANTEIEIDVLKSSLADVNTKASKALERNVTTFRYSSETIFTTYGVQYMCRVGNMVFIHLLFRVNAVVLPGGYIGLIPEGYRPYGTYSAAYMRKTTEEAYPFTFVPSGHVISDAELPLGRYEINFCYPLA